jgi:hypothetical protein
MAAAPMGLAYSPKKTLAVYLFSHAPPVVEQIGRNRI